MKLPSSFCLREVALSENTEWESSGTVLTHNHGLLHLSWFEDILAVGDFSFQAW